MIPLDSPLLAQTAPIYAAALRLGSAVPLLGGGEPFKARSGQGARDNDSTSAMLNEHAAMHCRGRALIWLPKTKTRSLDAMGFIAPRRVHKRSVPSAARYREHRSSSERTSFSVFSNPWCGLHLDRGHGQRSSARLGQATCRSLKQSLRPTLPACRCDAGRRAPGRASRRDRAASRGSRCAPPRRA
jgi:hypothetical protein